jgi:hypothetical protein
LLRNLASLTDTAMLDTYMVPELVEKDEKPFGDWKIIKESLAAVSAVAFPEKTNLS